MKQPMLTATLMLVACASPVERPRTTLQPQEPASRDERASRIDARLRGMPGPGSWIVPEDMEVPSTTAAGVALAAFGTTLEVPLRGTLLFDGQEVASARDMSEACETRRLRLERAEQERGQRINRTIHVWADRRLRMSDVRAALSGCSDRALLLARAANAERDAPPCPESLSGSCEGLRGDARWSETERIETTAGAWRAAIGRCDALARGLEQAAFMAPDERNEHYRRFVAAGLRECECAAGTDPDALEYLAFHGLGGFDPAVRALELGAPAPDEPDRRVGEWVAEQR